MNTPSKATKKQQKPSPVDEAKGLTSSNPASVLLPMDEPFVRKRISRKTKIKLAIVAFWVVALVVYLACDLIFHGPLMTLLSNREILVHAVQSAGIFGPLLYIILQIVQTVVAPIPGQLVGSVGGFLFGGWGILWTTIGSLIGYFIVFVLSRQFGRPLLEKIFKKSIIAKFDFILNGKGTAFILFAIFLLPGFPDDLVCYMAGLTNLPISQLMILVTLGRLPTIVLTNFFGAGLGEDNMTMVAIIALLTVVVLGLVVWQRERIMKFLKNKSGDPEKPH